MERNDAEREARKNAPLQPFRYFTKVGEESEIVIVDDKPRFVRHEHALKNRRTGRYDIYVPCIDEHCACPACNVSERPSYFAMYLTVIDFTGYEDKDGNWIEFSKKLLVVKQTQQKKIVRFYDRERSLRGMRLTMVRNGEKEAAIGDPEFVGFLTEEELRQYVFEYTDKEGEVHTVYCDEPYDYEALMPPMTEDEIRALVGGDAPMGSRRNDDRDLGRGRGRADAGDGWDDQQRRIGSRRAPSAPARRPATAADDVQDVDYQEAPPARGARPASSRPAPAARPAAPARAAPPARRAPARAPAQETIDPDDLPDAGAEGEAPWQDDAPADPPQRTARQAPARRTPAPAPEPAAARPANPAARRANLRRGG